MPPLSAYVATSLGKPSLAWFFKSAWVTRYPAAKAAASSSSLVPLSKEKKKTFSVTIFPLLLLFEIWSYVVPTVASSKVVAVFSSQASSQFSSHLPLLQVLLLPLLFKLNSCWCVMGTRMLNPPAGKLAHFPDPRCQQEYFFRNPIIAVSFS